MLKLHYAAGFAFLALSGSAVVAASRRAGHPVDATSMPDPIADYRGPAAGWFRLVKPYCNTVEAETVIAQHEPPEGLDGLGYAAACFALAGRIERAREYLLRADPAERWQAAGIVFEVGHPVADAGDDRSAGPIMELVVEFWPNHYGAALTPACAARARPARPGQKHPRELPPRLYDRRRPLAQLRARGCSTDSANEQPRPDPGRRPALGAIPRQVVRAPQGDRAGRPLAGLRGADTQRLEEVAVTRGAARAGRRKRASVSATRSGLFASSSIPTSSRCATTRRTAGAAYVVMG
ncbi:MAG: hypothetical protein R2909_10640 [Gemmatimonadales bacterium]